MSETITIGTWIIPAIITMLSFVVAIYGSPRSRGNYDFSPIIGCGYVLIATIVSLAAWLAWSLS